jgi:hypothetical protein
MYAEEDDVMGTVTAELFDPALARISLGLQLGGRKAGPDDIATRVLSTLDCLEGLDSRPTEWLHVNYSHDRMCHDNRLPRTHREMALCVEDGVRKDDVGSFYPSWGYYLSILGFLAGSARGVCPSKSLRRTVTRMSDPATPSTSTSPKRWSPDAALSLTA